jgi:hypothetical protein
MNFPFIIKSSMAEMKNLSSGEIGDLQNDVYKGVYLLGYYTSGDTLEPVIYHKSNSTAPPDEGSVVVPTLGGIKLEHKFKDEIDIRYFGVKGDGIADETSAVKAYFKYINDNKLFWVIPGGFKIIVKESFDIKTSGRCEGTFLLNKEISDVTINISRDFSGETVDITTWNNEIKRGSLDVNFINNGIANLHFSSTEVLIERIGLPMDPYLKTEFVRTNNGKLTTPLVCHYKNKSTLTVTKFSVEEPIIIDNLTIEAIGNVNEVKYLLVSRDNITLNNLKIINKTGQDGYVALELDKCADIVINSPFIIGFKKDGVGYGIANYESIGVVINDGNVINCRHGYTGRNSVDVTINRGVWEDGIDDHWTDRFVANSPRIKTATGGAAFQFAGNDITLNSPIANGYARIFFGIRLDTPSLGGIININNPVFTTMGVNDIYLFSYTTPTGLGNPDELPNYTNMPTLPQSLNIVNPVINTDADIVCCFYQGVFSKPYTTLGKLKINDTIVNANSTTLYTAALFIKDGVYQQGHTEIEITGRLTTNAESTVNAYITSRYPDSNKRARVTINNCFGYKNVRFSGMSLEKLIMNGGEINNFDNDNSASLFDSCNIQFKNVEFGGGTIHQYLTHALFQSCVFKGSYTTFPINNSMINNLKYTNVTGLPSNIVNDAKAPFQ